MVYDTPIVLCNDVQGGWEGEDNIDIAPLFCDAANGNYSLRQGSACLPENNNCNALMGAISESCSATSAEDSDDQVIPIEFALHQNYPNPFNPRTVISYALPRSSHVAVTVYNILGQRVRRLIDTYQPAGWHTIQWDGKDQRGQSVATGIYLYRISAGDYVKTKKMLLLK